VQPWGGAELSADWLFELEMTAGGRGATSVPCCQSLQVQRVEGSSGGRGEMERRKPWADSSSVWDLGSTRRS
jgi:hypothetical protein